ncbi:Os02g0281101 [Oryza sativa Japonica Group]|uniref:Os02g0281101 protein n=1 Tax=Oryza sativa subsp. japonica TaxID=39947 RepID=A0A0P0VHM2_ORYSJ|nr:hypothetical protein EE612_010451 [Oryza sativa]BAS78126.1 Os02g0281101 [Oryza sativa Japonica Group]
MQQLRSPILDPFWSSLISCFFTWHGRGCCQVLCKSFYIAVDTIGDFLGYCISTICYLFPVNAIKPGVSFHRFRSLGPKARIFVYLE